MSNTTPCAACIPPWRCGDDALVAHALVPTGTSSTAHLAFPRGFRSPLGWRVEEALLDCRRRLGCSVGRVDAGMFTAANSRVSRLYGYGAITRPCSPPVPYPARTPRAPRPNPTTVPRHARTAPSPHTNSVGPDCSRRTPDYAFDVLPLGCPCTCPGCAPGAGFAGSTTTFATRRDASVGVSCPDVDASAPGAPTSFNALTCSAKLDSGGGASATQREAQASIRCWSRHGVQPDQRWPCALHLPSSMSDIAVMQMSSDV